MELPPKSVQSDESDKSAVQTIPYAATGAFSSLLTDYIAGAPVLAPFYRPPA
ncbi:MAG: hypothetical protein WKG07_18690 [Hymenobacter sp.]